MFSFHEFSLYVRDNVLSSAHWCNHSKINLEFVPEGQTEMKDLRKPRAKKKVDDVAPDMFPQHTTRVSDNTRCSSGQSVKLV